MPLSHLGATLLLLLLLVSPEPAAARAQSNGGLCDSYADEIAPAEAKSFSDSLRLPRPARHAGLLLNVRIENGNPEEEIAPFVSMAPGRASAVIVVPRGFRRLNCKVVVAGVAYSNRQIDISDADRRRFSDCVARTRDPYDCFVRFIDAIAPAVATEPDKSWTPEQQKQWRTYIQQLQRWVDLSFQFILQHEAGHIVTTRGRDPSALLRGLGDEAAADLQATLALSSRQYESSTILPAVAAFGLWSMIDSSVDWSGETHPPFACRARSLRDIYMKIVPKMYAIRAWSYEVEENAPITVQTVESPRLFIAEGAACPASDDRVKLVSDDLDLLIGVFHRTRDLPPHSGAEIVRILLTAPLKTEEARALIAEVVAAWVPAVVRNAVGDGDVFMHPYTAEEKRGVRVVRAFAAQSMKLIQREMDQGLISSEVFGETVVGLAMLRIVLSESMNTALLTDAIRSLERYSPGSASIPVMRMLLAIDRGDCKRARAMAQEAIRIDPSRDSELSTFTNMDDRVCRMLARSLH